MLEQRTIVREHKNKALELMGMSETPDVINRPLLPSHDVISH
ncbi:hypothetical protein KT99_06577 [Shewanella benthica KT99]|uniref:Uncharacterized protein n=1 Tax=Shewanella benthica KT99 TaxID=314608 RepID=A9CV80_9GAMM|nr:hypothetical protein KT99_06577 [Shewanella benthica KT99]